MTRPIQDHEQVERAPPPRAAARAAAVARVLRRRRPPSRALRAGGRRAHPRDLRRAGALPRRARCGAADGRRAPGARVHELGDEAFRSLSRHVRADGLLAIVARPPTTLADVGEFVLVAERIERPGNLGSAIRTAAAAGADTVIVCDARTDVFHPDVVRGSVGTIFSRDDLQRSHRSRTDRRSD
jgi:hypothetical protein